jgi:hypothetical protein
MKDKWIIEEQECYVHWRPPIRAFYEKYRMLSVEFMKLSSTIELDEERQPQISNKNLEMLNRHTDIQGEREDLLLKIADNMVYKIELDMSKIEGHEEDDARDFLFDHYYHKFVALADRAMNPQKHRNNEILQQQANRIIRKERVEAEMEKNSSRGSSEQSKVMVGDPQ